MTDTVHYEVQSSPAPDGRSGIYEVVRMRDSEVQSVLATFYGRDRDRAYSLAGLLDKEMRKWRLEYKAEQDSKANGNQSG
jgi:hypothetical protein